MDLEDLLEEFAALADKPRPIGEMTLSISHEVGPSQLLLDGSELPRALWPALWAWAQENHLVRPGLFTDGDGAATFGLPDLQGRDLRNAGGGSLVLVYPVIQG